MAVQLPVIREPLFALGVVGNELIVPMEGADTVTISAVLVSGAWATVAEIEVTRSNDGLDWAALSTPLSLTDDTLSAEAAIDTPWLRLQVKVKSDDAAYVNLTVARRNETLQTNPTLPPLQ